MDRRDFYKNGVGALEIGKGKRKGVKEYEVNKE